MGVCMTFKSERPVIYPADGPAVTGPGNAFVMRNPEKGLYYIRLYARNDISRRNPTGSHVLGTYKNEANAHNVIDILEKAVDANAAAVYVPAENEAGDLITEKATGRDGKKYPVSHKITRQRIIDAIKDNPGATNTFIAEITGAYRGTVAKYRAAMSEGGKQAPKRKKSN